MIDPISKYILVWNLITTLVYSVSIFIDTLVIGFHLTPLLVPALQTWTSVFSIMMVLDVFLKFFVAIRSNSADFVETEQEEDVIYGGQGEH